MEILVVYDIGGTNEALAEAKALFRELGLYRVLRGVFLPKGTLVGIWAAEATITEIRDTIAYSLERRGVVVTALLVADYTEFAWRGPKVPEKTGKP